MTGRFAIRKYRLTSEEYASRYRDFPLPPADRLSAETLRVLNGTLAPEMSLNLLELDGAYHLTLKLAPLRSCCCALKNYKVFKRGKSLEFFQSNVMKTHNFCYKKNSTGLGRAIRKRIQYKQRYSQLVVSWLYFCCIFPGCSRFYFGKTPKISAGKGLFFCIKFSILNI